MKLSTRLHITALLILPFVGWGQAELKFRQMPFWYHNDSFTVRILPFPMGKKAAVSLTFDDNLSTQSTALSVLNTKGLTGSCYIIAGQRPWAFVQAVGSAGHEVGSHGVNHVNLVNAGAARHREIQDIRDSIRLYAGSHQAQTIAWPQGASNDSVRAAAAEFYIGARSQTPKPRGYEAYTTRDYYDIGGYLVDENLPDSTWDGLLTRAKRDTGWFVPVYHGIDSGLSHVSSAKFARQINKLATDSSVYVAPFSKVLKYVRQRNAVQMSVQYMPGSNTGTQVDSMHGRYVITLNHGLDTAIYNEPFYVEVRKTWGWLGMRHDVYNGIDSSYGPSPNWIAGSYVCDVPWWMWSTDHSQCRGISGSMIFRVTKGQFTLNQYYIVSAKDRMKAQNLRAFPNPSAGGPIRLQWQMPTSGTVQLIAADGRLVYSQVVSEGSTQAQLLPPNCSAGVYTALLQTADGTASVRVVVTP